jgi:cell division protein FtsB
LIIFVIWGIFVAKNIFIKYRDARNLEVDSVHELEQMQHKETDLKQQIKNLSTDRGKEAEVRNRYRVARPGESLVIIVDDQQAPALPPPPPTWSDHLAGWWNQFRTFIGI